jgi:hypothetical protein
MVAFPQISPQKSCMYLSFPLRATCPAHLILLYVLTRIIFGDEHRSLSSPLRFTELQALYSQEHTYLFTELHSFIYITVFCDVTPRGTIAGTDVNLFYFLGRVALRNYLPLIHTRWPAVNTIVIRCGLLWNIHILPQMCSALVNTGLPVVLSAVTHRYFRIILTINAVSAKECVIKKSVEIVHINRSLVSRSQQSIRDRRARLCALCAIRMTDESVRLCLTCLNTAPHLTMPSIMCRQTEA